MSQDRPPDHPSDSDPTSGARSPDDQPTQQWQGPPDNGNTQQAPYDTGQYNQPQYGQPQYGQPQYGQPQYGQPQYGQPEYNQAQYGQPAYGPPGGYPPQAYAPAGAPTNTMAILALIFAFVFAPLGIVFGLIARGQIKRTGESGDGLALAGLILGAIFTLLIVASILFLFVLASAAVNAIPDLQNLPTDVRDFPTSFPFPPTR